MGQSMEEVKKEHNDNILTAIIFLSIPEITKENKQRSQLDGPPESLTHLPVLRELEGQLLSLDQPDAGDGRVTLLPP